MIRQATIDDVKEFFSERGLSAPDELTCNMMVVDNGLLVSYATLDEFTCEVHICAKRKALKHVKELIGVAEHFLQFQGFEKLYTAIKPEFPTAIKLAERAGFKQLGCYNDHIVFGKEL